MADNTKVMANPEIILREEFDDWAILFDPDTGNAFGLNPIGVLIWKRLDGRSELEAIVREIRGAADPVPPDVEDHVRAFIENAVRLGLAGYCGSEG
jgi:SynChlorMet cassette protein ScmD